MRYLINLPAPTYSSSTICTDKIDFQSHYYAHIKKIKEQDESILRERIIKKMATKKSVKEIEEEKKTKEGRRIEEERKAYEIKRIEKEKEMMEKEMMERGLGVNYSNTELESLFVGKLSKKPNPRLFQEYMTLMKSDNFTKIELSLNQNNAFDWKFVINLTKCQLNSKFKKELANMQKSPKDVFML